MNCESIRRKISEAIAPKVYRNRQEKENNVVERRGFLQLTDVYFQFSLGGIL